ncbi:hypothetical protein [Mesorhizobium sp. M0138]|uniref:hypothetical protein n=1 Tax=Mesorhizobium sp. M0138 TaxID=2956891 RepID=UPI00333CAA20
MAVRRPVDFHQGGTVCHRGVSRPDHLGPVRRGQLFRRCRPVLAKAERSDCHQTRHLSQRGLERGCALEPGQYFHAWDHEKTPKKKGGKIVITVSHRGEVECHEGWLSRKEARRAREGGEQEETAAKLPRPEVTGPMHNYIDLHRHAAVRAAMLDHAAVALRLVVAHAITGSGLWQVRPEPQRAANETVTASLAGCKAEAAFGKKRREVLALLGSPDEDSLVAGGNGDAVAIAGVFARLLALCDDDVMRVLTLVMAETLAAGSAVVEALGNHLNVDMGIWWQPDDAFFDLLRDKEIANSMLAESAASWSRTAMSPRRSRRKRTSSATSWRARMAAPGSRPGCRAG